MELQPFAAPHSLCPIPAFRYWVQTLQWPTVSIHLCINPSPDRIPSRFPRKWTGLVHESKQCWARSQPGGETVRITRRGEVLTKCFIAKSWRYLKFICSRFWTGAAVNILMERVKNVSDPNTSERNWTLTISWGLRCNLFQAGICSFIQLWTIWENLLLKPNWLKNGKFTNFTAPRIISGLQKRNICPSDNKSLYLNDQMFVCAFGSYPCDTSDSFLVKIWWC